jgi:hypothetical protein
MVRDERGTSRGEAIGCLGVGMGMDAPMVEMDEPAVDVDAAGGWHGVEVATRRWMVGG